MLAILLNALEQDEIDAVESDLPLPSGTPQSADELLPSLSHLLNPGLRPSNQEELNAHFGRLVVRDLLVHYTNSNSTPLPNGTDPAPVSDPQPARTPAPGAVPVLPEMRSPENAMLEKLRDRILTAKLVNGGIFYKHGKQSEDYRLLWCTPDLKRVQWAPLNKDVKNTKTKEKNASGVLTADINGVYLGYSCPTSKFAKRKKDDAEHRCFTVATAQRTLDLECISQQERDLWVLTFQHLMHVRDRVTWLQKVAESKSAVGTAAPPAPALPPIYAEQPSAATATGPFSRSSSDPIASGPPSSRRPSQALRMTSSTDQPPSVSASLHERSVSNSVSEHPSDTSARTADTASIAHHRNVSTVSSVGIPPLSIPDSATNADGQPVEANRPRYNGPGAARFVYGLDPARLSPALLVQETYLLREEVANSVTVFQLNTYKQKLRFILDHWIERVKSERASFRHQLQSLQDQVTALADTASGASSLTAQDANPQDREFARKLKPLSDAYDYNRKFATDLAQRTMGLELKCASLTVDFFKMRQVIVDVAKSLSTPLHEDGPIHVRSNEFVTQRNEASGYMMHQLQQIEEGSLAAVSIDEILQKGVDTQKSQQAKAAADALMRPTLQKLGLLAPNGTGGAPAPSAPNPRPASPQFASLRPPSSATSNGVVGSPRSSRPDLSVSTSRRNSKLLTINDVVGRPNLHSEDGQSEYKYGDGTLIESADNKAVDGTIKDSAALAEQNPHLAAVFALLQRQWSIASDIADFTTNIQLPDWVPDSASKVCTLCQREFGLVRRRHHCRLCAQLFCSDCSRHRQNLLRFKLYNARVCDPCFVVLQCVQNPPSPSALAQPPRVNPRLPAPSGDSQ